MIKSFTQRKAHQSGQLTEDLRVLQHTAGNVMPVYPIHMVH